MPGPGIYVGDGRGGLKRKRGSVKRSSTGAVVSVDTPSGTLFSSGPSPKSTSSTSSSSPTSGSSSAPAAPKPTARKRLAEKRIEQNRRSTRGDAKDSSTSLARSMADAGFLRNRITPNARATTRRELKEIGARKDREAAFREAGATSEGLFGDGTGQRVVNFAEIASIGIPVVGAPIKTLRAGKSLGPAIVKGAGKLAAKLGGKTVAQREYDKTVRRVDDALSKDPARRRRRQRLRDERPYARGRAYEEERVDALEAQWNKGLAAARSGEGPWPLGRVGRDWLDWELMGGSKPPGGKGMPLGGKRAPWESKHDGANLPAPPPYWGLSPWANTYGRQFPLDGHDIKREVGGKRLEEFKDELGAAWMRDVDAGPHATEFDDLVRQASDRLPELADALRKAAKREKNLVAASDAILKARKWTGNSPGKGNARRNSRVGGRGVQGSAAAGLAERRLGGPEGGPEVPPGFGEVDVDDGPLHLGNAQKRHPKEWSAAEAAIEDQLQTAEKMARKASGGALPQEFQGVYLAMVFEEMMRRRRQ